MRVTRYTELAPFAARVQPFLFAHEAKHCLPIGIIASLLAGGLDAAEAPYLASVEQDDGRLALVAIQTPPHNLVLSLPAEDADVAQASEALAADLHTVRGRLPGVVAVSDLARAFSAIWASQAGATAEAGLRELIYKLTRVQRPRAVPGFMRRIGEQDRALLHDWLRAFMREAVRNEVENVDHWIDERLHATTSGMYIWEDGQPVCMTGYTGPTPHGIRIGPVYTPPELRGRGYASALVADVSQRLLDEGRQFCFLFTDLANPTSNHIYRTIGYEPVVEVAEYGFSAPTAEG